MSDEDGACRCCHVACCLNTDGTLIEMEENSLLSPDEFDELPDHDLQDESIVEDIAPALRQLQAGTTSAVSFLRV